MALQVEITQKKNGTLLVAARPAGDLFNEEEQLRANPYRDVSSFLHVLGTAQLDSETRSRIERAATEAEQRPEAAVICEVPQLGQGQLAKIGLN